MSERPAIPGVVEAAGQLAAGRITSEALVRRCIDAVDRLDRALNCFVHRCDDAALVAARESDRRRAAASVCGPLDGVPFAVKDNIDIAGLPTSNGLATSRVAGEDAEVVARLRAAGAIALGKLNLHEAALGATTDNPHHGRTFNPWRPGFTPGGSSGGSAAAVAGGLVPFALGTDTMGSVRLPAAYCGVVGLKPSRERSPNQGVVPLHGALDHVGPLARSVADTTMVAHALGIVAGGAGDSSRAPRLARVEWLESGLGPAVRKGYDAALARIGSTLAPPRLVASSPIDPGRCRRAGLLLVEHEAQARLAGWPGGIERAASPALLGLLDYGARATPERLAQARETVAEAGSRLEAALAGVDAVIAPTTPQVAFAFDAPPPASQADLTAPANFAGCPAISVPGPLAEGSLPVGIQLIARRGEDEALLAIAAAVESAIAATHGD